MNDYPCLSVLMSVYNGMPNLERAMESIATQSFGDFEFLIIDDASTDGSRELLEKWEAEDERIRLILNETNRGLGYSLDKGVKEARGEWIARMDDDDIACPNRLKKQLKFIEENPGTDILGGWAVEIDEDGNPMRLRQVPTSHEDIVRLIWTIPVIHPTVMFRRRAIQQVGSYDAALRRRQDYDLWFRCAAAGLRFANIPEPLIHYRFTDNYYEKNDLSTALQQVEIGWRGCRLVGASPITYVGIMAPLIRALLPRRLSRWLQAFLNKFDPRKENKETSKGECSDCFLEGAQVNKSTDA